MHFWYIFLLCVWFVSIFWTFLPVYLCQYSSLGFVNPPSFSIGLYVLYSCSLVFKLCETHNFFSIFIWLHYVVSNQFIQILHIVFSYHYLPIFNMCIFNYRICLLWHCWKGVIFSNRHLFKSLQDSYRWKSLIYSW